MTNRPQRFERTQPIAIRHVPFAESIPVPMQGWEKVAWAAVVGFLITLAVIL